MGFKGIFISFVKVRMTFTLTQYLEKRSFHDRDVPFAVIRALENVLFCLDMSHSACKPAVLFYRKKLLSFSSHDVCVCVCVSVCVSVCVCVCLCLCECVCVFDQ